jgi:ribosomal protein L7/L12
MSTSNINKKVVEIFEKIKDLTTTDLFSLVEMIRNHFNITSGSVQVQSQPESSEKKEPKSEKDVSIKVTSLGQNVSNKIKILNILKREFYPDKTAIEISKMFLKIEDGNRVEIPVLVGENIISTKAQPIIDELKNLGATVITE